MNCSVRVLIHLNFPGVGGEIVTGIFLFSNSDNVVSGPSAVENDRDRRSEIRLGGASGKILTTLGSVIDEKIFLKTPVSVVRLTL